MEIQSNIIANKYNIDKFIGNGKFGKVYRGIINKTNTYVAIKLEDKSTSYKLLKRETSILKYLYEKKCRSIPSVYWFGEIGDSMGLIMTYYDCSLFEYLNIKTISESKLNYIMVKCIHILESIHSIFVIHRDIKPHNFMIKNGEIFLIDFGLATFGLTMNIYIFLILLVNNSLVRQNILVPIYMMDGHHPDAMILYHWVIFIFTYLHKNYHGILFIQIPKMKPTIMKYIFYIPKINNAKY